MTPLRFEVHGKPQGARRHRVDTRGSRPRTFHDDAHVAAEMRITTHARMAAGVSAPWCYPNPYEGAVKVAIVTWHARPLRLSKARKWWGTGPMPYVGKPDADNVAKLVLDALTEDLRRGRAGVWRDDTQVAELTVVRRYVAVDDRGGQGAECTAVTVVPLEDAVTGRAHG